MTTQGELKVLDFFIRNKKEVYNLVQIRDGSKSCYNTTKKSVRELLDRGLLIKASKIGKSTLYKLDKDEILKLIKDLELVVFGDE